MAFVIYCKSFLEAFQIKWKFVIRIINNIVKLLSGMFVNEIQAHKIAGIFKTQNTEPYSQNKK